MADYQDSIAAIRQSLLQLRELIDMAHVPKDVRARGGEIVQSAIALADDVLKQTPAAALGSKGGTKTVSTR